MKNILSFLLTVCCFTSVFAQEDSLVKMNFENTVSLDFPANYKEQKLDFRLVREGKSKGAIYSFFCTDEYRYKPILNGLELDSLYDIIITNTLQVYATSAIESNFYTYKFGELRGKYLYVQSTSKTNPYIAEYYIVCVSGRIFVLSATYLNSYPDAQKQQVSDFVKTIQFNDKLGYQDQLNR